MSSQSQKVLKLLISCFSIIIFFHLISLYSFLLFHILAEFFSIVIAFAIFVFAWNTRIMQENSYLIFIGIAYLFVGIIDMGHTLSYKGMNIFKGYDTNLTVQLWIIARYIESISLLLSFFFLRRKLNQLKIHLVILTYAIISIVLLSSIFLFENFPNCYMEGFGLTIFKKSSEYLISAILFASLFLLHKNQKRFDKNIVYLIAVSVLSTVLSELSFTFYESLYSLSNQLGHFFKLISFYLFYRVIFISGFSKPYWLLFRDLREKEKKLIDANNSLDKKIKEKTKELYLEKERAEENEEKFRSIFENSKDAIGVSKNGIHVFFNEAYCKLFGYEFEEDLVGKAILEQIAPSEHEKILSNIRRRSQGEFVPNHYQTIGVKKDGSKFPFDINVGTFYLKGEEYSIAIIRDISEQKHAESQIKKALAEKTILLRELYHRTRNNMQVISSLLHLKRSISKNDEVKREFLETENKIQAMSLVHQKLYQSKDLSNINLKNYVIELVNLISDSYFIDRERIIVKFSLEELSVLIDIAIPLGLVLNELVSNIFKHAFPQGEGNIFIDLKQDKGKIILKVQDNGIGLKKPFDLSNMTTLGVKTVVNIVEKQLGGTIIFNYSKGMECTVKFDNYLYIERV